MKILVIQLARFGDIYTTWPVLRAIKRENPQGELHVLVRKKFKKALVGLESVDKTQLLDTQNILEPVLLEQAQLDESLARYG
jgi:ADP-heptose:LPS heptosyltransferase